jgi:hypothetical protein
LNTVALASVKALMIATLDACDTDIMPQHSKQGSPQDRSSEQRLFKVKSQPSCLRVVRDVSCVASRCLQRMSSQHMRARSDSVCCSVN